MKQGICIWHREDGLLSIEIHNLLEKGAIINQVVVTEFSRYYYFLSDRQATKAIIIYHFPVKK